MIEAKKLTVQNLLERAIYTSQLDKLEVLEQSLRLFLAWYGDNPEWPGKATVRIGSPENKPLNSEEVLSAAHRLISPEGFTLDDLLGVIYGAQVIVWEAKSVKNRLAQFLRAAGYTNRQLRREGKRVLAWGLPPELQREIVSKPLPF